MVAGMWWFFTLLMVSSYTANLAAFLTTESPDFHFSSLTELIQNADEKNILYGAMLNGSTRQFFEDNAKTYEEYRKAWEFMQKHKNKVLVPENKDGVALAKKERYAFFMESSTIEYTVQRHCDLQKVNGLLDEKGYGIAMRKNSSYRNTLSTAILILQNSGRIEKLRERWWEERKGGGQCEEDGDDAGEAKPLDLKNVGGVFWVTIFGTAFAFLMAMLETTVHALKKSRKTKTPSKDALKEEIKFYFKFREMVKPVPQISSSEDSASNEFQSRENLFGFIDKHQPSVETLESATHSNKSKKSKRSRKRFEKQRSSFTC